MDRKGAWLTPNTPASGFICRTLHIPNGVDWLAIVNGALDELTKPWNFDAFGTSTVQQTIDAFSSMFDASATNSEEPCRMVGEIVMFGSDTAPVPNWLPCDGSSILRSAYPDLFTVIGVNFGSVDGSHFNVPDLRSRVAIGGGTGTGLSTYGIGASGGEETHVLTTSELATHTHIDSGHAHTEGTASPTAILVGVGAPVPSAVPFVGLTGVGNASLTNAGSDAPHNNLQPYLALQFFIVAS